MPLPNTAFPVSRRTCLSALVGTCLAPAAFAQAQGPTRPLEPPLEPPPEPPAEGPRLWLRDTSARPVRLQSLDLRTEVMGHAVQHRLELVFYNPNARVLEGELQFPLHDGQWVSGFELDIDGALRPAVPVEKARGQQVFEELTRARVDPALLEATEGRHHKLRLYPLPAQGTRRVVLHVAQRLPRSGRLVLPLHFSDSLPRLDATVQVAGVRPDRIGVAAPGVPPQAIGRHPAGHDGALVWLHLADLAVSPRVELQVPARDTPLVVTQWFAGQSYFHAELPVPMRTAPRAAPRRITVLWDASGSGAQRDHGREFALLDAYFRALGRVEVELRVGRDVVEPPQHFSVRGGRWDSLQRVLDGLAYDGATDLPALLDAPDSEVALLFSDGLSNWGPARTLAPLAVPLYAIADAEGVDTTRLRHLAEPTGGRWLDLAALSPAEAVRALQTRRSRLLRVHSHAARDIVAVPPDADDGHLTLAGVLAGELADDAAELLLDIEDPEGRVERQSVVVRVGGHDDPGQGDERDDPRAAHVAQRWAALRMAALEADLDDHRAEIRRLGRAFGLVSRETSLIVLDTLADYVRFEIEPPAALRAEYERALAQATRGRQLARSQHLDQVAARFAEQVAWWEQDFPKGRPPAREVQVQAQVQAQEQAQERARRRAREQSRDASPAAALALRAPAPAPLRAERARMAGAAAERTSSAAGQGEGAAATTIRLTPWSPDTPYARRLRAAAPEAVYQRYLDERPDFVRSTAFFLDAADVLFDKQRPELALRVLSNLAEMDLDNRHLLRVLGYRLLQARAPALAIPVLQRVLRLSPTEPQSYRDLGLAHAEAAQWQPAVDQLWEVVSRPWDGRFPDIDLTALAELNMVVARAARDGRPVDTRAIDRRLLRLLPLDLRITLAWDADNTDIDLWVTDPNGEKVFYGHRQSHQGGHISHDVTGGYGPEEFALRVAKPGRYLVQAQFYGHRQQVLAPATTLMLVLSTGFGRADQKDERVTLRLDGPAETVTVGSFEVTPATAAVLHG
ncbi:MAG: DUF2135 domain-containing protein [Rhizobacter sp.]|nr:DUF2135 domain-containing protein [Rhizobacter sp.]